MRAAIEQPRTVCRQVYVCVCVCVLCVCVHAQVEAGGEMIITQLFYDVDQFLKFVKDCKSVGITAPIVPGTCVCVYTCVCVPHCVALCMALTAVCHWLCPSR